MHPRALVDWGRGGTVRAQETWTPGRDLDGCRQESGEGRGRVKEETSSSTTRPSLGAWREKKISPL